MPPSRLVTACESCRRLKRKCDYLTTVNGPCSNCKMRGIGDKCVIIKSDTASFSKNHTRRRNKSYGHVVKITLAPPDLSQCDIIGNNRNTNELGQQSTSPSDEGSEETNCNYQTSPSNSISELIDTLSPKFLTHCLLAFNRDPEWSYFLNFEVLHDTIYDIYTDPTQVNHSSAGLVFIIAALTVYKRGVQLAKRFPFVKDRDEISHELESLHVKWSQRHSNTFADILDLVRSNIVRSYFCLMNGRYDDAWRFSCDGIVLFKSLATPQGDFFINPERRAYETVYVALYSMETGICSFLNHESILGEPTLELSSTLPPIIRRRWEVQQLCRKTHRLLQIKQYNDSLLSEQGYLEQEMSNAIVELDRLEGTIRAYGQMNLVVCLLKLRTHLMLLEYSSTISDSFDKGAWDRNIRVISHYANLLSNYLDMIRTIEARVPLSTAPNLAMYIFQGMSCVWALTPLQDQLRTRFYNDGKDFNSSLAEVKATCQTILDKFRPDILYCKRTCMLLQGLDMLASTNVGVNTGSAEAIRFAIPNSIKVSGMICNNVSKHLEAFSDKQKYDFHINPADNNNALATPPSSREDNDLEEWINFEPAIDDKLLWQQIEETVNFDMSIPIKEDNDFDDPFILQ